VLFLQKWNDDPKEGPLCPRVDDYEIFFATQRVASKDNRGEKILVHDIDGKPSRDKHGHYIVSHDLFNHEGLTQDGIAEAFNEFARKKKLSFFSRGM
jgi:type I restriction enzyme M protein